MPEAATLTAPDRRLRQKSAPVARVDSHIQALMDQMLATVREAKALGLAAIQLGEPVRVIVVDIDADSELTAPIFMANPTITYRSRTQVICEESCLSLPGVVELVRRAAIVRINHLDYNGQSQTLELDGLAAVCAQHEIDHLDGVLFTDRLSITRRLARGFSAILSGINRSGVSGTSHAGPSHMDLQSDGANPKP
jgi:peptide deformylase